MCPAPELGGAFIAGQGVHAYVKPDGHYQDDIFFYDANAHRWICCYPGSDVRNLTLTVDANGFETDSTGQPVPVAWCGHMYNDITYNGDLRALVFLDNGDPYWQKPLARRTAWLDAAKAQGRRMAPAAVPFYYNTLTARFERRVCTGQVPRHSYGRALLYIPALKKSFYWPGGGQATVYFHDAAADTWTKVEPKGDKPPFGMDYNACYDPTRQRVYVGGGSYPSAKSPQDALFYYDLKADTWTNAQAANARLGGMQNNICVFTYDAASDRIVALYHGGSQELQGVHVYDPAANRWADPSPLPANGPAVRATWSGYYDAALNAHFVHAAGDSTDNGTMWAYRLGPAGKAGKAPSTP